MRRDRRVDVIIDEYATHARPGERVIRHYSNDCAECDCAPTHDVIVPSIVVGTRDGVDRCLVCGTGWTSRELRCQPSRLVFVGARSSPGTVARLSAEARGIIASLGRQVGLVVP